MRLYPIGVAMSMALAAACSSNESPPQLPDSGAVVQDGGSDASHPGADGATATPDGSPDALEPTDAAAESAPPDDLAADADLTEAADAGAADAPGE